MRRTVLRKYAWHKPGLNKQKCTDTILTVKYKHIKHKLDRIEYLRDSVRLFKNQFWGFVDDYQSVFLQPRYASARQNQTSP
jgi:hypothetical protein